MDVEVSAGRDSTWRRPAAATVDDDEDDAGAGGGRGGGVEAQVVPLELYDSARAKIDANLRWLFAKAYGIGKAFFCVLLARLRMWMVWLCHAGCCICLEQLSIVQKLNSEANTHEISHLHTFTELVVKLHLMTISNQLLVQVFFNRACFELFGDIIIGLEYSLVST